jgi:uncharacterized membrane protein YphA (DoxX/SURF4 family)
VALLPIRFFFGVTFLYAGLDKLVNPGFFDPASPGSIQAQMLAFERTSPLGALVALIRPEAGAIGLLIAVAEVAIGIGALTGLAFRIAAMGGALLSLLFFLTVSWGTRPYYLGPDLPYAVGWLTLALAGHGGLLIPSWVAVMGAAPPRSALGSGRSARADAAPSPERRALLQSGLLAVIAVAVSSLAVPFRILGVEPPRQTDSRRTASVWHRRPMSTRTQPSPSRSRSMLRHRSRRAIRRSSSVSPTGRMSHSMRCARMRAARWSGTPRTPRWHAHVTALCSTRSTAAPR